MKLLADHNVEAVIIERLRAAGHDVLVVAEALPPEALDEEILAHAKAEARAIVTNDKDFGDLTFFQRQASAGILLLRMPSLGAPAKAERLHQVLPLVQDRLPLSLVVISEKRIRRRPFPGLDIPPFHSEDVE